MKTSSISWKSEVTRLFTGLFARRRDARVAILGVGNELAGDDAVGVVIARSLVGLVRQSDRLLVLDGGQAPESFVGKLEAFAPDLVLILDAADLGAAPGTVRLLDVSQVPGSLPTTHSLSLTVLTHYLRQSMDSDIYFLGIQPETLEFDTPLSVIVGETAQGITQFFQQLIEAQGLSRRHGFGSAIKQ